MTDTTVSGDAPDRPRQEVDIRQARSVAWACVLRRHAHLRADVVAVRSEDRSLTYRELDARVDRAAAALAARGVRSGDRVAILSGNRPEFLEALGATNRLGAIAVPINFRLVGPEVAFHLSDSGARTLVVDAERAAVGADARRELMAAGRPNLPMLVVADPGRTWEPQGADEEDWEMALADAGPWVPDASTAEGWGAEAPALLMYTSGTTGRPKGAVLTHLNLFAQTMTQVRTAHLLTDTDVTMVTSPLFHIAGIGAAAPALLLGNRLVLAPGGTFDPVRLLDVMESERVTHMFLVPTLWQALCETPGVRDRDLALVSISWGASPALPSTLRAMAETFPGVQVTAAFGQTEMSPVTCSLAGEDAITKLGSVGRPVALVDARVVDEEMRDVARGEVGEIVYRAPTLMAGYWNRPDATADALTGGWFHSGDLVRVDEDDFITVVDRKKDMIISGGENISSVEVEQAIDSHPKVRDVAVVAAPHPTWVETPVAVVTPLDPADPPTEEEIIAWAKAHLASYKKPSAVEIVDMLPRNAAGKVLKTELRKKYWP
jgi:fatty-acyl-CoA synthase